MRQTFRITSYLEGISYILLLFIGVPLKYVGGNDILVKLLGMPHGVLFMAYVVLAFMIKKEMLWTNKVFLYVLLASIIPFGTFYIDKKYCSEA